MQICLVLIDTAKQVYTVLVPVYSPPTMYEPSSLFHIVIHVYLFIYFILTICLGAQQYLIVVLICISLMTNKIEQLFLSYWPFEYAHFCKMPVHVFCLLKKWEACLSLLKF